MREIKFKAYIKQDNEIVKVFGLCFENILKVEVLRKEYRHLSISNKVAILQNPEYFEWVEAGKECILLEFTGLKDKNGQDIYEGDIIKINAIDYKGISIVIFQLGTFMENYNNWPLRDFNKYEIEIIGNKYENPELEVKDGSL